MIITTVILFVIAIIVGSAINDRDPKRQAMTKEQRLEYDIGKLSPHWQKTIQLYRNRKIK